MKLEDIAPVREDVEQASSTASGTTSPEGTAKGETAQTEAEADEKQRRRTRFTDDAEKYSEVNARTTVQNAIDSGILNDTSKTHDFVDLLAKISSDKGITFNFTNNARLAEKGLSLEGVVVNGYTASDGISVNTDSAKYLNTVVGHELMHVLEGTELSKPLQKAVFEYAKTKGEYDTRYAAIEKLYANIEGADVNAELAADLVGDYLFTDEDFVKNLSVKHRNVFQKIFDEIKYLCKIVTAGSREARELERAKKIFAEAYRASGDVQKNTVTEDGVRYSITEPFVDLNGTAFGNAVLLDTEFFDGISPRNWGNKLRDMVNERADKNPFIMPIEDENGNTTMLQFAKTSERVTKNSRSNHEVNDKLSFTSDNISKLTVIHIDEVISVSEENNPYYTNENDHQWLDKNGWLHRNANVINPRNGSIYNVTVDIAKTADGRTVLYATNGKIKKVGNVQVNSLKIKGSGQNSNFGNIISQTAENVKKKNSLSENTQTQKRYGDYNVSGEDVKLEDIAPVREDAEQASSTASGPPSPKGKAKAAAAQAEDIAPVKVH